MSTGPSGDAGTGPPTRLAYFVADFLLAAFAEAFKLLPRTRKT